MRFDGSLKGIGGCPMAKDELVGNINSEWMIDFFKKEQILQSIDEEALQEMYTNCG
jgi:hydroxymethylglutaryl-CoA lyase